MSPLVLIILDGFGFRTKKESNAIALANAPTLDHLMKTYPHTLLQASGEAVGLPPGIMGNSEVGHLTIGSGRINNQDLTRIHAAIDDGSFFKNDVLVRTFQKASAEKRKVHLMGLLSDAGVHSHQKHLFALLKMAQQFSVTDLLIHCFLDGRDTSPTSSQKYLKALQKELRGKGSIATLIGRYYAMDRDCRWERVQLAYEALVEGKGELREDPVKAVQKVYAEHVTDEFIKPILFGPETFRKNRIDDGDVVIFFNFRPDRAREITSALTDPNFSGFKRTKFPRLETFVCLTQYDKKFSLPVAFPPQKISNTLAEVLSRAGMAQFHTAETEKYAHVTYFLNGGQEEPFPGEERLLIPSPKDIATYDKKPEMNAPALTEATLKKLKEGCPVILMNYANPDMVGHSGLLGPTIRAVEVIDECIGKICAEVLAQKGTVIITADHGNCEEMMDQKGGPHTAHTTNLVPFLLVGDLWKKIHLKNKGGLQDVAPTILQILSLPKPAEMTGETLIEN